MITTTITRRITTALAGPAIAAGLLAGGLALGAAPAQAQSQSQASTLNCLTTGSQSVTPNSVNPLTRPAQVNAVQPPTKVFAPATSCTQE